MNNSTNLISLLKLFTDASVPEIGPEEDIIIDEPNWQVSETGNPENYPGGGLGRHSMLYIGENCNKMYLVHEGKVIWTYSTGKGWEYDDIWMLSNGNILFSRMSWAGIVTPQKKLIWKYPCAPGTEVHSLQPVGKDEIIMMVNGEPPKIIKVNTSTGEILWEKVVPCSQDVSVHGQFRRMRYTCDGTFLLSHLSEKKVVEYDADMNEIWSYEITGPWAAIRLKNGNTLITSEAENRTIEVNKEGQIVWQVKSEELPEEYRIVKCQTCVRLENGNTILCSQGSGGTTPQLVEVTPEKEVAWCLKDFKNLGPATAVQILSETGIPEVPGDCER